MQGEIRTPEDLGVAVREIRVSHGLSQGELATRLGISQRYLSELERGKPKVFDSRYLTILSHLGIHLIYETGTDE